MRRLTWFVMLLNLLLCLGAARQAFHSYRQPLVSLSRNGGSSQLQRLTSAHPPYRLRHRSTAASRPPSNLHTEMAAPTTSDSAQQSPLASLESLLSVCVDGLCSRRLRWAEIALLVREGRLEALGRLDWQLEEYAASKTDMLAEYHSVTDRLRDKRLAAPCRLEGGRKRCDWTQQQQQQQPEGEVEQPSPDHPMRVMTDDDGRPMRVCWWPNEFGYSIDASIGHDLVWSDRYLSADSRLFQRILSEHKPADQFEVVYFINPPHLRSIPDLHHIHVFSRSRRKHNESTAITDSHDGGDSARTSTHKQ